MPSFIRVSIILFAQFILFIAALAAANAHDNTSATDIYTESCEAAFRCYDTECRWSYSDGKRGGAGFQDCIFQCVWSEVGGFNPVGVAFFEKIVQAVDFCTQKKGANAPEGKTMKCAMKQIKTDTCEH